MRLACWITKVTDIHSEYVFYYCLHLHGNSCYANVSQCYIYTYIAHIVPCALVFMLDIPILDTHFSASLPLHDCTLQVCLLFRPLHCIVWGAKHNIPDCKILRFKAYGVLCSAAVQSRWCSMRSRNIRHSSEALLPPQSPGLRIQLIIYTPHLLVPVWQTRRPQSW
jgi:hypothetical protein